MKILQSLDVTGNPIVNVPTPVANGDAANKQYVDTKAPTTTGPTGYVASFSWAGGVLSFAGSTADTGITLANVPVTVGRNYLISVLTPGGIDANVSYAIMVNDGTGSQQIAAVPAVAVSIGTGFLQIAGTLLYSPTSSGLKTFKVEVVLKSGAGTIRFVGSSPSQACQLTLTDIGGTPSSGLGLIASHVLTASQTTNVNTVTDGLTVTFTPVIGGAYRLSLLTPYSKTDTSSQWLTSFLTPAALQVWAITPGLSGQISGSVLYVAVAATPLTVTVRHGLASGSNNLTLPGSATAPRQLWVERIG